MTSMLRKLSLASAIAAAATFSAVPALAATSLTVPFSFVAAGKLCPAGHYHVDRNPLSGVVTLQGADGSHAFAWVAGPGEPSSADTHVILKFDNHGSKHYLHSIQYGTAVTARIDREAPEDVPPGTMQGQ